MAGLGALGPIASPIASVVIDQPAAEPAEVHGQPADPAHGQYTWADPAPMPWVLVGGSPADGAAAVAPGLLGDETADLPAGNDPGLVAFATETGSHGGPWPSFGTDDLAVNDRSAAAARLLANAELRAVDPGLAEQLWTAAGNVTNKMPWRDEADYVTAGETQLQPLPPQMQGQLGFDRVQGTPALNQDGFDSAHVNRTRAVGEVPGNFLWLDGREQRPMVIQVNGQSRLPTGPGSPFEGQAEAGAGAVTGAVLSGLPNIYQPPIEAPSASPATPEDPVWSTW